MVTVKNLLSVNRVLKFFSVRLRIKFALRVKTLTEDSTKSPYLFPIYINSLVERFRHMVMGAICAISALYCTLMMSYY